MAAPHRTEMVCHFSWEDNPINGIDALPQVTRQPENNFCGAQATIECFESRARILCAKLGMEFPTLSIQHMIDMLKDELASAKTVNDKKIVMMEENTFNLLKTRGVTTKADYDAAPPGQGYVKNVEGLHHYRICHSVVLYMKTNAWGVGKSSKIIDTIQDDGPVYGWFAPDSSFAVMGDEIYRAPQVEANLDNTSSSDYSSSSEASSNSSSDSQGSSDKSYSSETGGSMDSSDSQSSSDASSMAIDASNLPGPSQPSWGFQPTHAVLLYGFGATRKMALFDYQNNWGPEYPPGGRGLMECSNIIAVIAPVVDWHCLFVGPANTAADAERTEASERRSSKRVRRSNVRLSGPEWF